MALKDLKILIVGPNSDRGGTSTFHGIVNALREIGVKYAAISPVQCGSLHGVKRATETLKEFAPDLILVLGCCPANPLIRNATVPVVCWNSEEIRLPHHLESMKQNSHLYKWIFHWDESALSMYNFYGHKHISFLPQAFCPYQHVDFKLKREPYIQFIGSVDGVHENRNHLFWLLDRAKIPLRTQGGFDMRENSLLYSRAAFSINLSMNCHHFPGDSFRGFGFQQRVFESLGSNCPVITNHPEEYPAKNQFKGLVPGRNILFYTKDNLIDVCRGALADFTKDTGIHKFKPLRTENTYRRRLEMMYEKLIKENVLKESVL